MSTSLQDQFAEAFRGLRSAFGVPITFGSLTVTAVVAESALSRELALGGFQEQAEFIAKALVADLPALPVIGSPVTYKGAQFKVERVATQPGHPVVEFTLKAAKR